LYRDEVYNRNTTETNIAELICAKQRNGMADFLKKIYFEKETMNFRELQQGGFDNGSDRF
jgi:replicative DNA helicase